MLKIEDTFEGLPTPVRQFLFDHKQYQVARFLDGLYACGFRPGDIIPRKVAQEVGALISMHSDTVTKVLKASVCIDDREVTIFREMGRVRIFTSDCHFIYFRDIGNQGKNAVGRPQSYYLIPDFDFLHWGQIEGPKYRKLYTLRKEDLISIAKYHRGVLRSHNEAYDEVKQSRKTRGKVAGSSPRSTVRYDRELGTKITPTMSCREIHLKNLSSVPEEEIFYSKPDHETYLLDDCGNRYPAIREIAEALLNAGSTVTHHFPGANRYAPAQN